MRPTRRGLLALGALGLAGCGAPAAPSAAPSSSGSPSSGPSSSPSSPPPSSPGVSGAGDVAAPQVPDRAVDPALVPVRLQVPDAGVDVGLVQLGVAADGTLEVPADYAEVGWFRRGPAPGETGPAVVAGHVDSRVGPAPFGRLHTLAVGDPVTVVRADGAAVVFHVDGVQQYAKTAFPTAAVYGPVPGPALRLVTCGGDFDDATGHYVDNVVVYAS